MDSKATLRGAGLNIYYLLKMGLAKLKLLLFSEACLSLSIASHYASLCLLYLLI